MSAKRLAKLGEVDYKAVGYMFDGLNGDAIYDWVHSIVGDSHPDMSYHRGEMDGHWGEPRFRITYPGTQAIGVGGWVIYTQYGEWVLAGRNNALMDWEVVPDEA